MPVRWLFGYGGRVGRGPFAAGLAVVAVSFWIGIQASLAALPLMAQVLAPRGINAGFALNLIWAALGLLAVWSITALIAKRLHDRGHSGWWAAATVVPLAALAVVNDAIFLVSRSFVLPAYVQWGVIGAAGAIAVWVLWECAQASRVS